jgi:hypothetical protein
MELKHLINKKLMCNVLNIYLLLPVPPTPGFSVKAGTYTALNVQLLVRLTVCILAETRTGHLHNHF